MLCRERQGEASAVRVLGFPAVVRRMLRPYMASDGNMVAGRILATPLNACMSAAPTPVAFT